MGSNYQFVLNGKAKEKKFAELFINTEQSTPKEDKQEKWDIKIVAKVDVKGLKKIDRTDKEYNESWHWIELKNNAGNDGWLYGQADYFAFETLNYFIVVDKMKLQLFINKHVYKNKIFKEKKPYKIYQRKGKQDQITIINSLDLCHIADSIIRKKDSFIKKDL